MLHLIALDAHTLGRTPLVKGTASRLGLYLTTHNIQNKHSCPRQEINQPSQEARCRRPTRPKGSAPWLLCKVNTIQVDTTTALFI